MSSLIAAVESPTTRKAIVASLGKLFRTGSSAKVGSVTLLRHRVLHVGDSAIEFVFQIRIQGIRIQVGELYVQQGVGLALVLYAAGSPSVTPGQATTLAKTLVVHISATSLPPPADTMPPAIHGELQLGQILTATPGTWAGKPTAYAYQWFRCDAAGGACVAIAGSTDETSTVSTADAGQSLAVSVSATNPAGSTVAMSAATSDIAQSD
jgi:hypothetical protein